MADTDDFTYPGNKATVTWNGKLCIHIGECGRAEGELFVGGRKPWCQPDLASDDETEDVVLRCPTGALSAKFDDGSRVEQAPAINTIQVAYNGPLFVRGDLQIDDAPADVPGLKFRAALCRCGQSKNKPYCDNSHLDSGFSDYGAVGRAGDAGANAGGPLQVKPAPDGPLLIKGNVTLVSSSGRESWRGSQAALCRCGASNNKPFCDGQHKKVGFKSE
ncbi:MAG: CDGSH iron-sulfur domain-containing protein [Proteobacteria bacterium]|nr:CDGSH iron-sulfur domain-containing protein [Pseudomonadota bacterium]